ncbi:MAG: hypothetical protein JNL87_19215 [Burkholderiaceae bacterium]|nr:hypothetical protein [Burkholderiaceae bacterium]
MRWRARIILSLLPLLASCSALRLTYDQGPLLAYWWLDSYADFSPEQAPRMKRALADWFDWHRATQLGDYAQALSTMQAMAVNPVTAAQACNLAEGWQRRAELAFDRAVPALAETARSLTIEQISHIERRQRVKQEDLVAEYLQPDPAERQKAALERTIDRAESIYGRLDESQRRLLAGALLISPFDARLWLAERRQRQADLVQSLRRWHAERSDADTVQSGLRRLAADTTRSPRPEYAAYAARLAQANCALAAQLHNSTTAAQRQRAVDRLQAWEADLRALAAP